MCTISCLEVAIFTNIIAFTKISLSYILFCSVDRNFHELRDFCSFENDALIFKHKNSLAKQ